MREHCPLHVQLHAEQTAGEFFSTTVPVTSMLSSLLIGLVDFRHF
jgi:hypothetical protein